MKILQILLFITITISAQQPQNTSNASTNYLELIVSDLSILNRITNAIALQNAAHHADLKLNDLVSQFLRVDEKVLANLTGLDTKLVKIRYQSILTTLRAMPQARVDTGSLKTLRGTLGVLKKAEDVFGKIQIEQKTFSATNILNWIQNSNGPVEICEPSALEVLAKFTDVMTGEKLVDTFTERIYQANMVRDAWKIINCFRDCQNSSLLGLDTGYLELEKMRNAFVVSRVLEGYNKVFDKLTNLPTTLGDVVTDVARTHALERFNTQNQTQNGTLSIGRMVDESRRFNAHLDRMYTGVPSFTIGFQNLIQDLPSVSLDLTSPWFRAKISRGKSVKPLENSMQQFFKFSEAFTKIQTPWTAVLSNMDTLEDVGTSANHLELLETFNSSAEFENRVRASLGIFQTCWQATAPNVVNSTKLSDLRRKFLAPAEVLENYRNTYQRRARIANSTSSTMFQNLISDVLEANIPRNPDEAKVVEHRNNFRKAKGAVKLLEVFKHMKKLHEAQKDLARSFAILKQQTGLADDTFHLQSVLDSSGVEGLMGCLRGSSFDADGLVQIAEFLERVLRFSEPINSTDHISSFVQRISDVQTVLEDVRTSMKPGTTQNAGNLALKLNNSRSVLRQLAGGVKVLHQMMRVHKNRTRLLQPTQYPPRILQKLQDLTATQPHPEFWQNPAAVIHPILTAIDKLDAYAKQVRDGDLMTVRKMFKGAESVPGIDYYVNILETAMSILAPDKEVDTEAAMVYDNLGELTEWQLDFAFSGKNLDGAFLSVATLSAFFDDVFGFVKHPEPQKIIIEPYLPYWAVISLCFGFFACLLLLAFILYGFTKTGRNKYRNTYLYYFPNRVEFEKRWRYSLFMDRENGQNALIDASREINHINVQNILARGALVNVYSQFGNTPLHMATKRGFPKVVEVLIKNGADRTILNVRNQTPEEMIPKSGPDQTAPNYQAIQKIYNKYRRKTFRIRVPQEFPTHLFHIFIEKRTDDDLTSAFMNRFQGITSDEALPTTTHCICKSTDNGTLETDDVDLLAWIFTGVIMVRESWMTDCMADERLIANDSRYLVEHVKYHGRVYENCVVPWTTALAKGEMPFLYGAYVVFVMKECPKLANLTLIITTLGGVFLEEFPTKETFNKGSHPYLHVNLGPAFLIHDGQTDLSPYQNDPDQLFTLFTEQEFISFLLRREVNQDTSEHVIPQLAGTE